MRTHDRTCHCGHRLGHSAIQEEPEYTTWGWILLSMFGMTPRPHHIAFRCFLCRKEVGRSRDPKLLERRSIRAKAA
jgi:hypothetical protein